MIGGTNAFVAHVFSLSKEGKPGGAYFEILFAHVCRDVDIFHHGSGPLPRGRHQPIKGLRSSAGCWCLSEPSRQL